MTVTNMLEYSSGGGERGKEPNPRHVSKKESGKGREPKVATAFPACRAPGDSGRLQQRLLGLILTSEGLTKPNGFSKREKLEIRINSLKDLLD